MFKFFTRYLVSLTYWLMRPAKAIGLDLRCLAKLSHEDFNLDLSNASWRTTICFTGSTLVKVVFFFD